MSKAEREHRGQWRSVPGAKRIAGGNDTNFHNVRPKAQATARAEGTRAGWNSWSGWNTSTQAEGVRAGWSWWTAAAAAATDEHQNRGRQTWTEGNRQRGNEGRWSTRRDSPCRAVHRNSANAGRQLACGAVVKS